MAAQVDLETVTGDAPDLAYSAVTELRFRADDLVDLRNTDSPVTPPASAGKTTFTAAVAASTDPQTVAVSALLGETFPYQGTELLIVDAGSDSQEVVSLTAADSVAGTVTAIFRRAHAMGALLEIVAATYRKVVGLNVRVAPTTSMANFRMFRRDALPTGVFDAYKVSSAHPGSAVLATPLASSATYRHTRAPVAKTPLASRSVSAAGRVSDLFVELQWFVTNAARNDALPTCRYSISWDES